MSYEREYQRAVAGDGNGSVMVAPTSPTNQLMWARLGGPDGPVQLVHNLTGQIYVEGEAIIIAPTQEGAPGGWRIVGTPCAGFEGNQSVFVQIVRPAALYDPFSNLLRQVILKLNDDGSYTQTGLTITVANPNDNYGDEDSGCTFNNKVYIAYIAYYGLFGRVAIWDVDTASGGIVTLTAPPSPPPGFNANNLVIISMVARDDGWVYTLSQDGLSPVHGSAAYVHRIHPDTDAVEWVFTGVYSGSAPNELGLLGPSGAQRVAYRADGFWYAADIDQFYFGELLMTMNTSGDPLDSSVGPGRPRLTPTWCNRVRTIDAKEIFHGVGTTLPYTMVSHAIIAEAIVTTPAYQAAFTRPAFLWRYCLGERTFGVLEYRDVGIATGESVNPFDAPQFVRPTKTPDVSPGTSTMQVLVELLTDGSVRGIWGIQFEGHLGSEIPDNLTFNNVNAAGGANGFFYFAVQNDTNELERGVYRIDLLTGAFVNVVPKSFFLTGAIEGNPINVYSSGRYR